MLIVYTFCGALLLLTTAAVVHIFHVIFLALLYKQTDSMNINNNNFMVCGKFSHVIVSVYIEDTYHVKEILIIRLFVILGFETKYLWGK